jgi:hypothetical protein
MLCYAMLCYAMLCCRLVTVTWLMFQPLSKAWCLHACMSGPQCPAQHNRVRYSSVLFGWLLSRGILSWQRPEGVLVYRPEISLRVTGFKG